MRTTDSQELRPVGAVADNHELTHRARAYGEAVIRGDTWPISDVALEKLTWETSRRAKRRHGRCSYDGDGRATITLTEHTYDRAGFEACKKTVRHELVHAWQYQHLGEVGIVTDSGLELVADSDCGNSETAHSDHSETAQMNSTHKTTAQRAPGFTIETGHGDSFSAWVDLLDLPGRCSTYYDRKQSDFAYVYGCPECESWWGKHRLCKSVRQAAHGGAGSTGYRYCTSCEVLLHLRVGPWYLEHSDHNDNTIRTFVSGDWVDGEWTDGDRVDTDSADADCDQAAEPPASIDLPLIHKREAKGIERPR